MKKRIGLFGIAVVVALLMTTMISLWTESSVNADHTVNEMVTSHEDTLCEHCVGEIKQNCMDEEYVTRLVMKWHRYQSEYYEARLQNYVIGSVSTKGGIRNIPYEPMVEYEIYHRDFIGDIQDNDPRVLEIDVSMYRMLHEMHEYYGN